MLFTSHHFSRIRVLILKVSSQVRTIHSIFTVTINFFGVGFGLLLPRVYFKPRYASEMLQLRIDLKLYSDILMRGVFGLSTSGGGVVLFLFCVFFSPLSCTVHGVNEFDLILMFV